MRKINTHTSHALSAFNADAPPYEPEIWNDADIDLEYSYLRVVYRDIVDALQKSHGKFSAGLLGNFFHQFEDKKISDSLLIPEYRVNELRIEINKSYNKMLSTNCYAYAANDKGPFPWGFCAQPGAIKNKTISTYDHYQENELIELVEADGFKPVGRKPIENKEGQYQIGLLLHETRNEFHFIRQDNNGKWSHKLSHHPVRNTDCAKKEIIDPLAVNWSKAGLEFIQFFHAPKGGVKVGIPIENRPIIDANI